MENHQQVFYGLGGILYLIFSILSAIVLSIACKCCGTKGPSTLGGISIGLVLVLFFAGALIGGPHAFNTLKKQFGEEKKLELVGEQYDLSWSAFSTESPMPMLRHFLVVLGFMLPLLMLLGALLLSFSIRDVSYSQCLTLYFVYFVMFLVVFFIVVYGTTMLWQQFILSS